MKQCIALTGRSTTGPPRLRSVTDADRRRQTLASVTSLAPCTMCRWASNKWNENANHVRGGGWWRMLLGRSWCWPQLGMCTLQATSPVIDASIRDYRPSSGVVFSLHDSPSFGLAAWAKSRDTARCSWRVSHSGMMRRVMLILEDGRVSYDYVHIRTTIYGQFR